MTFQLDTSGEVLLPHPTPEDPAGKWASDPIQWYDLSPFTQGYIEALFASANETLSYNPAHPFRANGFSDLAPETLARIISDCDYVMGVERFHDRHVSRSADEGAALWRKRQSPLSGTTPEPAYGLPPLTVQLGDDGKVRFAEPARSSEGEEG